MPARVGGMATPMAMRALGGTSAAVNFSSASFIENSNDRISAKFRAFPDLCDHNAVMKQVDIERRKDAIERARLHSPFLRAALAAQPEIAEAFERGGAAAALDLARSPATGTVDERLRRWRKATALAVALGDLAS